MTAAIHQRMSLAILATLITVCVFNRADLAFANHAQRLARTSISANELQAYVDALADDMFEGREAGSRGGRAAGMYLATVFEKHGLRPAGDEGSYFQSFGYSYRNILAVLEGSDPDLKNEYVLIGAHYDHVGYGNRRNSHGPFGYVHNGADDNASGTAAVLELVEAIRMLPKPPRRSILFALWDGEEKGLLGSKHWVANPTVSTSRICTAINCDMIGRLGKNGLKVYGTRSSHGLRKLISHNNRHIGLKVDFTWELKANSDHWPFFQQHIPVLMFHTGLHDDYHRPSDDAERINRDGLQKVTRLLFNVALDLAERNDRPQYRIASQRETVPQQEQMERKLPTYPPRLGVYWKQPDQESPGVGIKDIVSNSAAFRAGLQPGDRIVRFAGQEVTSRDQLTKDVLWTQAPVEVVVRRPGEDKLVSTQVALTGKPVRIGISWRADAAEPGTVLLTRVVNGSAAQHAGLKVGDRIYQIAGRHFSNSDELSQLLKSLPSPLILMIERDGTIFDVALDAPQQSIDSGAAE